MAGEQADRQAEAKRYRNTVITDRRTVMQRQSYNHINSNKFKVICRQRGKEINDGEQRQTYAHI